MPSGASPGVGGTYKAVGGGYGAPVEFLTEEQRHSCRRYAGHAKGVENRAVDDVDDRVAREPTSTHL